MIYLVISLAVAISEVIMLGVFMIAVYRSTKMKNKL
jgi:hypothetical protein